jgi:uncharacterized UBP type Zn finger protein
MIRIIVTIASKNFSIFLLIFNVFQEISNVFGIGTQEDASEFLTTLLESMAKSIKFALNNSNGQSTLATFNNGTKAIAVGASGSNNKRMTTILDDIFSFQFRSRSKTAK